MGAGVPANTGAARASHRGACFAGTPAPTGIALAPRLSYKHAAMCYRCADIGKDLKRFPT
ncbi:hypothetical protein PPUN110474_06890 [Pseudomonas putida]|nr:hypothetical protein PPUN110474_06890 [Pseudomonas putida]